MTTPDDTKPIWRRPTVIAASALLVAALAAGAVWQTQRLPGDAAFEVAGESTTRADLREEVATLRSLYGVEPPSGKKALAAFWKDAAQASAVGQAMDRAAERRDVVVPRRAADQALDAYVQKLYGAEDDPRGAFVQALGTAGTSEAAVEREIRRQLVITRLYEDVVGTIEAPDERRAEATFTQRGCPLEVPEGRAISNIVVASEDEARQVRERLDDGDDFAEVARTTSADQSTRETGGALGVVQRAQLDETFGTAAFETQEGTLFGPVKSQFGWNVGQVTDVVPARDAAYSEYSRPMRQLLLEEERASTWRDWLRDAIDDADIRYADEYRPKNPDALPATLEAAGGPVQSGGCPSPEASGA